MTSTQGVRALLFDLGGIVIEIDFNRVFAVWAALSGERIETVKSRFSFDTFFERHERGEITARDYFASLRSSLSIDLSAEELRSFRKVFVSCEMGMRKPEPEAFAGIAAEIGVPLDEILFFDDTRENVEGARAVGMRAVHVRSVEDRARPRRIPAVIRWGGQTIGELRESQSVRVGQPAGGPCWSRDRESRRGGGRGVSEGCTPRRAR